MPSNLSLTSVVRACAFWSLASLVLACGGSRKQWTSEDLGIDDEPAEDAGYEGPIVVRVDTAQRQQYLEGFGASVAWYAEWFTQHPNRDALARILFHDLGFDILRLRNQHRAPNDTPDPAGIDVYHTATASLGHAPRVLLSSWSPPPELKASGQTRCEASDSHNTCSLKVNADGTFPYTEFGDYWLASLETYRAMGVEPYYVSIQNEPDYKPNGWEGCRFNETERNDLPGYDRALDAVANRLAEHGIATRLIGAETAQLQNGAALRYAMALNSDQLYGIAHHLYDGGSWKSPSSFAGSMKALDEAFPTLPKFQTEFSPTDNGSAVEGGFEVARLIHESVAVERASAYLHWELFWPTSGLVAIDNPWDTSKWQTTEGYRVLAPYHSVRHFARYTEPGDVVVACTSSSGDVIGTAYLSPDESRLTIVLLNTSTEGQSFTLDLSEFDFVSSQAFVTTETAPWQSTTPLTTAGQNELQLDARAIVTYVISKNGAAPE